MTRFSKHARRSGIARMSAMSWALVAVSIVCYMLLFGRGINNQFVSDDWIFLQGVDELHSLAELVNTYFTFRVRWFVRPVYWLVTWTLYRVFGVNAAPFHVFSMGLDVANGVLLGIFSYCLMSTEPIAKASRTFLAGVCSMLFLFSWRHHEAIFWYSSVNEPLSTFFRLASLLLLWYSLSLTGTRRWVACGLSLGSFAVGMFSKESAVAVPLEVALLLALLFAGRSHGRPAVRGSTIALASFVIAGGAWVLLYASTSVKNSPLLVERSGLGWMDASAADWTLRFVQHLNGNYLGGEYLPRGASPLWVEVVVILSIAALALRRKRFLWLFALAWILVAVAPFVAIVPRDVARPKFPILPVGVIGDRYLYYSAAGASLLLVASMMWLLDEVNLLARARVSRGVTVVFGVVLSLSLALNMSRIFAFEAQWDAAGRILNSMRSALSEARLRNQPSGTLLCLSNLPDKYGAAYVFRNGIDELVYFVYGENHPRLRVTMQPRAVDESGCAHVLHYNETTRLVGMSR